MDYRLEVEEKHVLGLNDSINENELVHEYSAKIIAFTDNDYDGAVAGKAEFYLIKVGTARNRGISLMDTIDCINQDVYEYGAAVIDPETDDVRKNVIERFEYFGGDLMFLHLMEILPAHRGKDVGLVAASRLIESYANGLVVCRPQPLQHVSDEPEPEFVAHKMEYERFSSDRNKAKHKLQKYWARLGFEAISDDGIYALGTATELPEVTLKVGPKRPPRPRSTPKKPR